MREGWEVKRLDEVCIIDPPKKEARDNFCVNDNVTFLPMEDLGVLKKIIIPQKVKILKDVISSYTYFAEDDVLLAKITPCFENGKLGIARSLENGIGFGSSEFIVFRSKGILDPAYLFYFLSTEEFRKNGRNQMSGAVGHKRVAKEFIKNYPVPHPPLPEQQRIVSILDEALTALYKAKENAEKNLRNAKELFESYLQSVFSNPGEDWEEKKLIEVSLLKSGTTISPNLEKAKGDVLYVKVADMNLIGNELEIATSTRYVNKSEITRSQIIPDGAIIFPKRGGAIATNKKRKIIKPTIVDLNIMAIIPTDIIDKDFLFYWFQTINLIDISNGTSIPQINNYSFEEMYIPFPTALEEQKRYAVIFNNLFNKTKDLYVQYRKKNEALEELRKTILYKAFNGELTTTKELEEVL